MPKITYITSTGVEHVVNATSGESAMQTAVSHRIPGIDGDCGGVAACGTCHVWVDQNWLDKIGPAVLIMLPQLLTVFQEYENFLLGFIIIVSMIFMREGIVPMAWKLIARKSN